MTGAASNDRPARDAAPADADGVERGRLYESTRIEAFSCGWGCSDRTALVRRGALRVSEPAVLFAAVHDVGAAVRVEVTVDGEAREVPAGATVAELVAAVTELAAGVAAVNGEVVPRRCWPGTQLRDGDRVEVVTAVPGG